MAPADEHWTRAALRRGWRAARWLVLPILVLVAVYLFRFSPLAVQTVSPARSTIIAEVMGTGTLEARVSTTISPKIAGRISKVHVEQGEQVAEDELLVQLDDEELKQQVAIAQANLEEAQAALVRLKADKERAGAVFERAQRHHARTKSLVEQNATSIDTLEQAAESMAVASAELARSEAAITEGQKALVAAEKTLEYQRARLADTLIHAPFPGLIVERHREAGDIAVPGSAILTLISTEVLWISAWVDETQMDELKVGQPARIVFRSQPERSYSGKVTRLGKQADRETREFVVDVLVTELPTRWAVGQRAEVYIETARAENALTIPSSSLLINQEQPAAVFVVEDGTARRRPLKLGIRGREATEVLEGLKASDRVIRDPASEAAVREGRRVRPQ